MEIYIGIYTMDAGKCYKWEFFLFVFFGESVVKRLPAHHWL